MPEVRSFCGPDEHKDMGVLSIIDFISYDFKMTEKKQSCLGLVRNAI